MRPAVRLPAASGERFFEEGCFILELSNHLDDPQVSIARARVPAGGRTRWHRLEGIAERYLVLSGRGAVELGELPPTEVVAGSVVAIPPGCRQRITALGDEELVFLAICTPRFVPEAYEDDDEPGGAAAGVPR